MLELRFTIKAAILALAVVTVSLLVGCKAEEFWKAGSKAPEISVLDLNDKTAKLSELRGKPVVVRFWTTGCSACIAAMPALDEFSKSYRQNGLVVLGINIGNSKPLVEAFANKLKLGYPILMDPVSITAKKYGVNEVPTTFFIDRNGTGRKVIRGEMTREVFENAVKELM